MKSKSSSWPLATFGLMCLAIGGLVGARYWNLDTAIGTCTAQVLTSEERVSEDVHTAADKALERDEAAIRELLKMRATLIALDHGLATAWRVEVAEADAP
jgi:hypothetical protein